MCGAREFFQSGDQLKLPLEYGDGVTRSLLSTKEMERNPVDGPEVAYDTNTNPTSPTANHPSLALTITAFVCHARPLSRPNENS